MKATIPMGVAAALMIASLIGRGDGSAALAQAAASDAGQVTQSTGNLHISARMRSPAAENLSTIDLNGDFTPVEIYKRVTGTGQLQWRVQKEQRVTVMDGQYLRIWLEPVQAAVMFRARGGLSLGTDFSWLSALVSGDDILKSVQAEARNNGDVVERTQEQLPDGRQILVVTVTARPMPIHGNEGLIDHDINASNTKRIYRFDAQTLGFEGLQVWVHPRSGGDVLVIETTRVEYPDAIADSEFKIDLPAGVQWERPDMPSTQPVPAELAGNRKPEQVARAFFEALSAGDKDRVQQYFQVKMKLPDPIYAIFAGLTIVNIGKPVSGGTDAVWSVPYEISLSNGETKRFRLHVRKDNPSRRWSVDGGF
jgi:hypothetical protein